MVQLLFTHKNCGLATRRLIRHNGSWMMKLVRDDRLAKRGRGGPLLRYADLHYEGTFSRSQAIERAKAYGYRLVER